MNNKPRMRFSVQNVNTTLVQTITARITLHKKLSHVAGVSVAFVHVDIYI